MSKLLPGTAATTDVASGKTFCSSSGFNQTGTAAGSTPGGLAQVAIGAAASGSSQVVTFKDNVPTTDSVIVAIASGNASGNATVSSVTGLGAGATWTQDIQIGSGADDANAEVWRCTNPNGLTNSVTVNFAHPTAGQNVVAYDVVGTLTKSSTATSTTGSSPYTVSVSSPASGFVAAAVALFSGVATPLTGINGFMFSFDENLGTLTSAIMGLIDTTNASQTIGMSSSNVVANAAIAAASYTV